MIINNKVVHFTTGINKNKKTDKKVAPLQFYEKQVAMEACAVIEEQVRIKEEGNKKNEITQKLMESKITGNKPMMLNKLYTSGKELLFKDVMYELFSKALLIDEEFITENDNSLRSYMDEHITKLGGFSALESAIQRTNSSLLKNIKTICEETTNKVCKRKITEDSDTITIFDLKENEKDDFNYAKNSLNIDTLSELVKSKVLSVVQDEKQKAEERQEFIDDLQNELVGSADDVQDENSVKESLDKMVLKNPKTIDTLFSALMENSYKELLESINTTGYFTKKRKDDARNYDTQATEDDIKQDEYQDYDEDDIEDDMSEDSVERDDTDIDEEASACSESIIEAIGLMISDTSPRSEINISMEALVESLTSGASGDYGPITTAVNVAFKPLHAVTRPLMHAVDKARFGNYHKTDDINELKKIKAEMQLAMDKNIEASKQPGMKYLPHIRTGADVFSERMKEKIEEIDEKIKMLQKKKSIKTEASLDMDMILVEAITKYTLIETLNTIKLDEMNYIKTKQLIQDLKK